MKQSISSRLSPVFCLHASACTFWHRKLSYGAAKPCQPLQSIQPSGGTEVWCYSFLSRTLHCWSYVTTPASTGTACLKWKWAALQLKCWEKKKEKKSTNPCEHTPVASAASSFLASPPKRNVSEEVRTSQLIARHERLIWKKPRRWKYYGRSQLIQTERNNTQLRLIQRCEAKQQNEGTAYGLSTFILGLAGVQAQRLHPQQQANECWHHAAKIAKLVADFGTVLRCAN